MLSLSLRQLEYVVAIARHEGISAAAQAMHVSQPSLSVALTQVEQQLNYALFIRQKGLPVVPTSKGQAFIERAQALIADFASLTENDGARARSTITCRFGIYSDLAPVLMAPLLKAVGRAFPDVKLFGKAATFEALRESLDRGRIDFAISYDLGFEAHVRRDPLTTIAPHIMVPPDHKWAKRKTIKLAQLSGAPLILADQGLSIAHVQNLFNRHKLTLNLVQRADSFEILRSMAANGVGVALSYTRSLARLSTDGKPLQIIGIEDAGAEPVVMLSNAANTFAASMARVMTCMRAEALRHL